MITKPIPGLIAKLAIPASIGMFFNTMYNVVDTYFSGLISTEAIAALSLSFPVFFVILSIGFGISTGATALIANALGSGDIAVVDIGSFYLRISAFIYWAYIILFVAVAALQGLKRPFFAIWIGLYRQIIAPAIVFYLISNLLGMGVVGIWWGIFLVAWSATIFTLFYAKATMNTIFLNNAAVSIYKPVEKCDGWRTKTVPLSG